MNIVVCVKRVPATDTKIKIGGDGKSIDPAGVEYVLNPYDEFALEEALKTREAAGEGTVAVITLGPADAQKQLRDCLARGADTAVLIEDGGVEHDAFSTAEILAARIRDTGADLVFVGKQAVDGDDNQVGARLAALLDMPNVSEIVSLTRDGDSWIAERDIEGGREKVVTQAPAVLSCNKGLNEPRYANLKGIMAAKKKPLETVSAAAGVEPASKVESLELPPARPEGRILGEGPDAVGALIEALKNEVKIL